MTTPTPRWTADELERIGREITHGWMAHLGYTPEQIAEYEMNNQHVRAGCDFDSDNGWFCLGEDGQSLHPGYDELDFCADLVMFVLEHPALAGVLTAVGGETRQEWGVLLDRSYVGRSFPTRAAAEAEIAERFELGRTYPGKVRQRIVHEGPWREVTDDPA